MEHDTAHAKATEITRILFAAGAKIGPYDRSILYPAIANGNIKQVAFLVDKGASDPSQALKVYWLLAHGADANHEDKEDLPLHQFIRSNKITLDLKKPTEWRELAEDTLNQLIKAGAKVSGVNEYGSTPLHVAAKNDNVRAAEVLITAGAKIMPRDKHGKTPLDYAESAAMIKLLKENGGIER